MTTVQKAPSLGDHRQRGVLRGALIACCMLQLCVLAVAVAQGSLTIGRDGPDFLCFWIAARVAVAGHADALYDWAQMLPMIRHALGHQFVGFVPWKYPPSALIVLSPLALLSLPAAHAGFALTSLAAFFLVIYRIAGLTAVLIAGAAPLSVPEIVMGQNGFATAAALGLALSLRKRRPLQAGLIGGLLSCKPQLFVLLPLTALLRRDGRWAAGIVISSGLLAVCSMWAFGEQAWRAFFQSLHANATAFGEGAIPWSVLQSLYALARSLGAGSAAAMLLQIALSFGVLIVVMTIDKQASSNALGNAAICAGTVLVTPFLLIWDLPIIGIGMAFMVADLRPVKMAPIEVAGLIGLISSTVVFFEFGLPVGTVDGLLLLTLVWRRYLHGRGRLLLDRHRT